MNGEKRLSTANSSVTVDAVTTPSLVEGLLSGAVGGISLVLVGHPFDLLKVRLQTAPPGTTTSMCIRSILSAPGGMLKGIYQGVTAPLIGVIPIFALYYGTYKWTRNYLSNTTPTIEQTHSSSTNLAMAAMAAASITTLISCPAERLKILLQVAPAYQNTGLNGMTSLAKTLWKSQGIKGFYRGFMIMFTRELPSSCIYFGIYETVRQGLERVNPEMSRAVPVVVAGGVAGMCSFISTAPLDMIKSIQQAELIASNSTGSGDLSVKTETRPSLKSLVQSLWSKGGWKIFYRGALPALTRAFPANAACFGGIELTHLLIENLMNNNKTKDRTISAINLETDIQPTVHFATQER